MAKVTDIDVESSVRKFLDRKTVASRSDETADQSEEVRGLLEAVVLSFLLHPQMALILILRARNTLNQVVTSELTILQYILDAFADIGNPDDPITDVSDLIEAQTALLEIDKRARVSADSTAYDRYNRAINRFLDQQLGPSLKRHLRGEFERSSAEAKQDIFTALSSLVPTHGVVLSRLADLVASVDDYQSVDLSSLVTIETVSRLRSSLQQLQQKAEELTLSKTVAAVELLSGAAALKSISEPPGLLDPLVDTASALPSNRVITARAVPSILEAVSTEGPWDLSAAPSPRLFELVTPSDSYSIPIPVSGYSGKLFVLSNPVTTAVVGVPKKFYLSLGATKLDISVPAGTYSLADVVSLLNGDVGFSAILFAAAVSGRLLLAARGTPDTLVVRTSGDWIYNVGSGLYDPPVASCHNELGFLYGAYSDDPDIISALTLENLLAAQVGTAQITAVGDTLHVINNTSAVHNFLTFSGVASTIGLISADSVPAGLVLLENGVEVDPATLDVGVGSQVHTGDSLSLNAPVTSVDGVVLHFDEQIPYVDGDDVTIYSALSVLVEALLHDLSSVIIPPTLLLRVQQSLNPVFGQPTPAQIGDAKAALNALISALAALQAVLVAHNLPDSQVGSLLSNVNRTLNGLEDRSLDRATEMLLRGQFSNYFALTKDNSSKSGNFLMAIEDFVRNDLISSFKESDLEGDDSYQELLPDQATSE